MFNGAFKTDFRPEARRIPSRSLALAIASAITPPSKINDAGLRETIKEICETAPRGSSVGGESPSVFNYYFARFGRTDLRYFNLSDPVDRNSGLDGTWVVVQDGRRYFENISLIARLESAGEPSTTVKIGGATAATIYKPHYVAQNRSGE